MDGDVSSLRSWFSVTGCEACVGFFTFAVGRIVHPHTAEETRQEVRFVVMLVGFECHTLAQPFVFFFFYIHIVVSTALWPPISVTVCSRVTDF